MKNLTQYFQEHAYQSKYKGGERVFGYYNKTPVMGTVAWDNLLNPDTGPEVCLCLDLPIVVEGKTLNYVRILTAEVKPVEQF
jgi:hypothetical protein